MCCASDSFRDAGHHSVEVRGRALESLQFKWKYGLVSTADLLQEPKVLRGLLNLLSIGDGAQTTAVVLLLLQKMAAADAKLAKALLELGALQQLHAFTSRSISHRTGTAGSTCTLAAEAAPPHVGLRVFITPGVWPEELLPSVKMLVTTLIDPGFSSSSTAVTAAEALVVECSEVHSPGNASTMLSSSRENTRNSSESGEPTCSSRLHRKSHQQLLHSGVGPSNQGCTTAPGDPSTTASESHDVHLVHGQMLHPADAAGRPAASSEGVRAAASADPAGLLHRPGTAGAACLRGTPEFNNTSDRPGTGSRGLGDAQQRSSSPEGPTGAAYKHNTSAFDERLLRARARADWREQDSSNPGLTAWAPAPTSSQHPGHITLPVVALSASDDQALFELNVRLQYSDDERLLLPALLELAGSLGLDLPAEALLQRQSILDNCLAMLSSSRSSRKVQQAAAAVLLQLISGLKCSLALSCHQELAHSEFGDQLVNSTAAASGAAPGPDATRLHTQHSTLPSASDGSFLAAARLVPSFSPALSALESAKTPMLDPSCPNSYPRLRLPDDGAGIDGVWGLTGVAAAANEQQQQCVDVTAAVSSICLHIAELLCNPERHYELLVIIEAALPLLVAPLAALFAAGVEVLNSPHQQQEWLPAALALTRSSAALGPHDHQAQQLQEELQAVWRGLLAALSRALASAAAVAADERAAALAAALSGQPADAVAAGDAAAPLVLALGGGADGAPAAATVMASGDWCGLCCWDLQSLNLLMLALRLLNAAPASWCTSSIVPPMLANAVAVAAADEALALLLPELRSSAAVLLKQLRPASLALLEAVQAVQCAAAAADEVTGMLWHELQQNSSTATDQWLQKVVAAVPSLGYNPRADAKLLKFIVNGLILVLAEAESAAITRKVGQLLVKVLSHQQLQVQLQALQLLATAAVASETQHSQPHQHLDWQQQQQQHLMTAQGLIMLPEVTEHLVVQGLADHRTRWQVSAVMLSLLQGLGEKAAAWLMPWCCWIDCFAEDRETSMLAEALGSHNQQMLQQCNQQGQGLGQVVSGTGFWQSPVVVVLQDLFHAQTAVRHTAGRQLLVLLMNRDEGLLDEYEELVADPFKGLLVSASCQPAAFNSSSGTSSSSYHLPMDPLTDASASLAANFTVQDVRNLLGVLANQGLAQELRRSAAEELLALSPEPQLLSVMAERNNLEAIWSLCVPSWPDEDADAGSSRSQVQVGAGAPTGDIFDMQLAVAALQLLAGLLARSAEAFDWMAGEASRLLVPLLPLVLHALHSVRRAVARVLALAVFGNAAQKWRGFATEARRADPHQADSWEQQCVLAHSSQEHLQHQAILLPNNANAVLLPEPFLKQFKFPFRVQAIPVTLTADAAAATAATTEHGPATSMSSSKKQQQQHAVIKQLVEQQQLLQLAGHDPAVARAMLSDCLPPAVHHVSQRVLSATGHQLSNVDVTAVAHRLLAAIAAARSHAACEQALRRLEQLGSSTRGLLAIAAASGTRSSRFAAKSLDADASNCQEHAAFIGWEAALERLLSVAPISADDQRVWLRLLQLLERMLAAAPLAAEQYTYLQLLVQRSITAWLQQPATAKDIQRPPLALALGSNSWELLKQQPSSAAAAAAVAEMLGLDGKDTPAAVAAAGPGSSSDGLLPVQVSRQALRMLLQLVKAVKRNCPVSAGYSQTSQLTCYSLSALQPARLIQLLCTSLLSRSEGVDYCCRCLAAAVLCDVIGALQDTALLQQLDGGAGSSSDSAHTMQQLVLQGLAVQGSTGGVGQTKLVGFGLHETVAAGVECFDPLICQVLMPVAGRQMPGFKGKALVKATLEVLLVLVQGPLVTQVEWSQAWAAVGGTFWLSRLCRDRESVIRWRAMTLVGLLLAPGATATQAMIAYNWPDCGHRLIRVATDFCEAHAVRAAAMRAVTAAMVIPTDILQQQQQPRPSTAVQGPDCKSSGSNTQLPTKQLHCFGLAPLLQLEQLWTDLVPQCLLTWQQRPVSIAAAAAAMAATAIAAAPDGVGRTLLLRPGLVAATLQLSYALLHQPEEHASSSSRRQAAAQEPGSVYSWLLRFLQLDREPQISSGCSCATAPAVLQHDWERQGQHQHLHSCSQPQPPATQHMASTLALQQQALQTAAATAAVQMLALAAAPASAGGGLLLLPAAVQNVLQKVPALLLQLISHVGSALADYRHAWGVRVAAAADGSNSDVVDPTAGSVTAALSVLQHQLALAQVAAAAALTLPVGCQPASQRKQQLLQLVRAVDMQPAQQTQQSAAERTTVNTDSRNDSNSHQGKSLLATAACLSHPGACTALKLSLVQLVGLLLCDADVAAAALGSDAAAVAGDAPLAPQHKRPGCSSVEGDIGNDTSSSSSSDGDGDSCTTASQVNEAQHVPGVPVGALLCRELASQLLPCVFTPTDAASAASSSALPALGDSSDSCTASVAPPEGLVVVFALQNLLAFSKAAKAAALEMGLHKLLMEAMRTLAAAVSAATGTGQGGAAGGSSSSTSAVAGVGGTRRMRARWFGNTAGTAAVNSTAATGTSSSRNASKPSTVLVAFGRTGECAAAAAAAAAGTAGEAAKKLVGPKVIGAVAGAGHTPDKQRQPGPQRRLRSATPLSRTSSSSSPAAGAAAATDSAQTHDAQQLTAGAETAAAGAGTVTAKAGDSEQVPVTAGQADGDAEAGHARGSSSSNKQLSAAIARKVNMRKLLLSVGLLRHMAYRCHDTQAALVGNSLIELLLLLWPMALQHTSLLLELLQLLNNLLPGCYQAQTAVASLQLPNSPNSSTLLQQVLCLLLPPSGLDQSSSSSGSSSTLFAAAGTPDVVHGAAVTLLHYASSIEGAAQLVKPGGGFLQDCQRLLRSCLLSCKKEHEPQQLKHSQQQRLTGLLQLLAVIAGRPCGQQALLRATLAPALVDLLVEVLLLPQQPAAVAAALLLLRNLSFSPDLRSPALSNGQLLPLLLSAAECLGPAQQPQWQLLDQGSLGRPGGSDLRNTPVSGWVPLYGKPLVHCGLPAGGAATAGGAFSGVGNSGSNNRPGSPAVTSAGAGGASSAVPSAADNVCCAVYAVSALWGLLYQGEKIKAAVRKLPAAATRIEAVRAQAQKLLGQYRQQAARIEGTAVTHEAASRPGPQPNAAEQADVKDTAPVADNIARAAVASAATAAADKCAVQQDVEKRAVAAAVKVGEPMSSGAKGGGGWVVKPGSLCPEHDAAWWLQQLVVSCTSVIDIMGCV